MKIFFKLMFILSSFILIACQTPLFAVVYRTTLWVSQIDPMIRHENISVRFYNEYYEFSSFKQMNPNIKLHRQADYFNTRDLMHLQIYHNNVIYRKISNIYLKNGTLRIIFIGNFPEIAADIGLQTNFIVSIDKIVHSQIVSIEIERRQE